jgi:hypothetical protein
MGARADKGYELLSPALNASAAVDDDEDDALLLDID